MIPGEVIPAGGEIELRLSTLPFWLPLLGAHISYPLHEAVTSGRW